MSQPSATAVEGRAIAARPSLCLIAALAALAAALLAAPAALAAPPAPGLIATDPPSPNTSLTPLIRGDSTGKVISVLPSALRAAGPIASAVEETTVRLYLEKGCAGPVVAEGTSKELDAAGIPVTVKAETTNFISARQSDESGTSGCSNTIEYRHVTTLPPPTGEGPPPTEQPSGGTTDTGNGKAPAAPRLRTVPDGWANDNTPLVTGSAPGASSVRIYADPRCQGSPVAKGTLAQFIAGLPVRVVDNDVTIFSGVAVDGGKASPCSDPVVYVEDSLTPHTRITMGPAAKTAKRRAIFRFTDTTGNAPGTTFLCRVDKRKWRQCFSPFKMRGLRPRRYLFQVKAKDPAGNVENKAAKRRFKVIPHP